MKRTPSIFLIIFLVILSACAVYMPESAATEIYISADTATVGTPQPVSTQINADEISASYTITLDDNGKVFNLHVGDTFLLNLGVDVYDWDVNIDNQSVISRHEGALGVFDALALGTANLTASGNPKCINSRPPCMMPSILFEITFIVQ